jgi:hypothetical protein
MSPSLRSREGEKGGEFIFFKEDSREPQRVMPDQIDKTVVKDVIFLSGTREGMHWFFRCTVYIVVSALLSFFPGGQRPTP